eukprot:1186514-Prorocentrum_minimum.AAC.2
MGCTGRASAHTRLWNSVQAVMPYRPREELREAAFSRVCEPSAAPVLTPQRPPYRRTDVPTPASLKGLGLVQETRTLRTELAPGNPGCSQRWERRAFRTFVPLVYCTTRVEDASGILHFIVSVHPGHPWRLRLTDTSPVP